MSFKKKLNIDNHILEATIGLLSPKTILKESCGEVTKPETKNHRTYKAVDQGLFCERIFGPDQNWKCTCGKYKGPRYAFTVCDVCGVECNNRRVRRNRIGHIRLPVPVVHPWYYKQQFNKIGPLLNIPNKDLENIIKYNAYIVIQEGIKALQLANKELKKGSILTIREHTALLEKISQNNEALDDENPEKFIAKTGGEAIQMLLKRLDLNFLSRTLRDQIVTSTSKQRQKELLKRLEIVEAFIESQKRMENLPEFMVLTVLVVISPAFRPLVFIQNHFAMSDLNALYRRILNLCQRIKQLKSVNAPPILMRNEYRALQEAVDALLDNSVIKDSGRLLKSLGDNFKGKEGMIRKFIMGKRVDFSARSVIIPGPELKLYQVGIPKKIALKLLEYNLIRALVDCGRAETVREAKELIEAEGPIALDELKKEVAKGIFVIINRQPTLHRLSKLAFVIVLTDSKAISLHPLYCKAFNADFDGDQMAIHILLSQEAKAEALQLMLASKNLLNPANGKPIVYPTKDMVLGLYYLTKPKKSTPENPVKGEGMKFYDIEEIIMAFNNNKLSIHACIKLLIQTYPENSGIQKQKTIIETTVGRALFNQYVPKELGYINELLNQQKIQEIVAKVYQKTTVNRTAEFLDEIKDLGFKHCYKGGLSISLNDIKAPTSIKKKLIDQNNKKVDAINENYFLGIITHKERHNQIIDSWSKVITETKAILMESLKEDKQGFNNIYCITDSIGGKNQVGLLGGIKGFTMKLQKSVNDSTEGIISTPILDNFKEGLGVGEYFISTHGTRKGLGDTSLKTAEAGYISRKLTTACQNIWIAKQDCGTHRGFIAIIIYDDKRKILDSITEQIEGRVSAQNIRDPKNAIIVRADEQITITQIEQIEKAEIQSIKIRSVMTCECKYGCCQLCYGRDLSNGKMVEKGSNVGVSSAQSIGEPGTQLTLRTFHMGGSSVNAASNNIVTASLEGIIHLENIKIVIISQKKDTKIGIVLSRAGKLQILDPSTRKELQNHHVPYGSHLLVQEGQKIIKNQQLFYSDPYNTVTLADDNGTVDLGNIIEGVNCRAEYDSQTGRTEKIITEFKDKNQNPSIILTTKNKILTYDIPVNSLLVVKEGEKVQAGQILAKKPRIIRKMQDITGGLPRVTELFEARSPSNSAILAPIEGIVKFDRKMVRGRRKIIITAKDGTEVKIKIPLSKHMLVQDQEYVKSGAMLSDGIINITDILAIEGSVALWQYIIKEIDHVYIQQGIRINHKHIEVIIRQMMQKVEVISSGDTIFMPGQLILKRRFQEENEAIQHKKVIMQVNADSVFKVGQLITESELKAENERLIHNKQKPIVGRQAKPAIAKLKIQGITKSIITGESFIAAASFQETNKVLASAAIHGKVDPLLGNNENIFVGNLIRGGTGNRKYQNLLVTPKKDYENLIKSQENHNKK